MEPNIMETGIRNGKLFCFNCGDEYTMPQWSEPKEYKKKCEAFDILHKDCTKTWEEPKVEQRQSVQQKASWWLAHGERGLSSEAMCFTLLGKECQRIRYPHDPDDFKRCYKLLETVPEWKNELHKLKSLHPVWEKLVENWDTLTSMYEQNVKENWKNCDKIGMYEFMQGLGC